MANKYAKKSELNDYVISNYTTLTVGNESYQVNEIFAAVDVRYKEKAVSVSDIKQTDSRNNNKEEIREC